MALRDLERVSAMGDTIVEVVDLESYALPCIGQISEQLVISAITQVSPYTSGCSLIGSFLPLKRLYANTMLAYHT